MKDPLLETFWTLALLPLLPRLIPWRRGEERWRPLPELGLALACGLVVVALCSGWLIRYHLVGGDITSSDFSEYCQSIAALRGDAEPGLFSYNRSRIAAWPPALLARHLGIIDGLAVAALIFTGVIGAGLYTWGRAVHDRTAGLLTALLFGAVGPLVILPRTVSLYTETIAAFVWSAAGAALALRYRTPAALLAGGIGAGWALLADVRGLLWALPAVGLSLLACAPAAWRDPRAWRWLPARALLVLLPVALSYPLGRVAYTPESWTLEQQAAGLRRDRLVELGLPEPQAPLTSGYLWGYSSPLEIPRTLSTLAQIAAQLPAEIAEHKETTWGRWAHVERWYPVLGACLLLAIGGLAPRPWQLVALLGTLVPFAVVLRSAGRILVHLRFLQTPMAGFPVLLAVGFAVLGVGGWWRGGGDDGGPGRLRWRCWGRPAAALAIAAALVTGLVPSWLSPVAPWRFGWPVDEPLARMIARAASAPPAVRDQDYACHQALWRDYHESGHPVDSRLYGRQ